MSAKPISVIEEDTPSGIGMVARHPKSGREIEAFGGAKVFRGKTVVDIGTGVGRLAFDAARVAGRVVGIDPYEDAIRSAREQAQREGITNLEFRVGDARTFTPRPGERFDLAILSWSL